MGSIELRNVLGQIDMTILQLAGVRYAELTKAQVCVTHYRDRFLLLHMLRSTLQRHLRALVLNFKPCLKDVDLATDYARSLVSCSETLQDTEYVKLELSEFLKQRPDCAKAEDWNQLKYELCWKFELEFDLKQRKCDVEIIPAVEMKQLCDLDIVFGMKKARECEILPEFYAVQRMCQMNLQLGMDEKACKVEYGALVKAHPGCNVTWDEYLKLIQCNIAPEFVAKAVECGMEFQGILTDSPKLCGEVLNLTLISGVLTPDSEVTTFRFTGEPQVMAQYKDAASRIAKVTSRYQ